jgi:protein-S-isoprenylcysteine O-methyltransferase Ste14
VLIGAGVGVNAWAMSAHGHGDLEHPTRLVTTGPYAYSRNPMYLGWHLIHVGVAVASGSGWVLATLPAAVAYAHGGIHHEETALARQFGAEFTSYRASVPRYLGW